MTSLCTACTSSRADVVFVVDDSSSVQRSNFATVLTFVASIVDAFTVGPEHVQVGYVRFSTGASHEFYLNTYTTKAAVIKDIEGIRYGTFTNN